MIMEASFDQHRGDSPQMLNSSGGGTPTPTSSSNSAPQPQVPTSIHQNGPSSWIKQQIQAVGAHVLPAGTPNLLSQPKVESFSTMNSYTGQYQNGLNIRHSRQAMPNSNSNSESSCANNIGFEPRVRGQSPDEGIQVESDV